MFMHEVDNRIREKTPDNYDGVYVCVHEVDEQIRGKNIRAKCICLCMCVYVCVCVK